VDAALRANNDITRFKLDTLWDKATHSEGWYFRSDHLPYARLNVPALMYSTNLHDDYHTPRDNPGRIDYPKLTRMAQWIYLTGWFVANAPERPKHPKPRVDTLASQTEGQPFKNEAPRKLPPSALYHFYPPVAHSSDVMYDLQNRARTSRHRGLHSGPR